jgi:PAS domain S-box-containing protein
MVVFLSVIAIETAILIPSYLSYQRDLQDRLEHVGRTIVVMALKPRGHATERDLLIYARMEVRNSELSGGALYRIDGSLIGKFGDIPELSPDDANGHPLMTRMSDDGKSLDIIWSAAELDLPVTVVGRINAEWIGPELTAYVWRIAMLSLVVTVFVGGVVMVISNRVVLRRILLLRRKMVAASEDPEAAAARIIQTPSRDELDDLSQEFNRMIERIAQDIAERKRAEDEMTSSQARLSAILDIAPEAVITIDRDMTITMFNKTAERIFGYSAGEILGQSFDILMPERFRRGHGDLVETFLRSSESARYMDQRGDIYGLRKDGGEFPAAASVSKLTLGEDRLYTVVVRDITARKRILDELIAAKNEAEIANQSKSEFLAAMSHELRTPLNAILGFSDIMRNEYPGPLGVDQYVEYVEDIHSSGDHLLSLLSDLLDISAIEAGKMIIKKQPLRVEEIAAECLKTVSGSAQEKNISLVPSMAEQLPDLLADRRSIKQILINLLTNAIKFTPQGGEVSLTVAASPSDFILTIADNGRGIPPDQLPLVTDPFTRVEKDPMHANEGWGLGLAITNSLVGLHQGDMKVESELGVGTTVTVTIPLAAIS